MVLIEAMACGLPVVSFDCPWGPRSIITDGEDGLLAENGNIAALASKLSMLMNDTILRKTMAQTAVRNVQRFSMVKIAERWKSLFNELNFEN